MPNAHTTQPMMNNTRYDSTSMTPVKTRGLAGKQTIPRMVNRVLQRIFYRFLDDRFLLIYVSPSNDFPVFNQQYQTVHSRREKDAILIVGAHLIPESLCSWHVITSLGLGLAGHLSQVKVILARCQQRYLIEWQKNSCCIAGISLFSNKSQRTITQGLSQVMTLPCSAFELPCPVRWYLSEPVNRYLLTIKSPRTTLSLRHIC